MRPLFLLSRQRNLPFLSCFGGLLLLLGGICPAAGPAAVAPPRTIFTNSVGPLPIEALPTVQPIGKEDLATPQEIEVPLRMRDYPKLLQRIGKGEKITPAELERDNLPLAADYTLVEQWLRSEGFEVSPPDPNRLAIFATGTVAQIQHALQVPMYRMAVKGRNYLAAQSHPSLPQDVAAPVLGIVGLQPFLQPHKKLVQPAPNISNAPPYLVKEIVGAYNGTNLGVTGNGQTIAILIDTVPLNSDLTSFWATNGISQSLNNITKIAVSGALANDADGEATLDVEWSSSVAPGAQVRVYATGQLTFTAVDKALQRIVSDLPSQPTLHQLSISLGLGETYLIGSSEMLTEAQYFATLASQGVSVFVSSGDAGSNPDSSGHNAPNDPGPLQVEYESSDPSVTGVGGTNLFLNSATGAETSETGWSEGGGGVSQYFARPSWQTGTGVPAGNFRFVPDVSLVASDTTAGYFFFQGQGQGVAGTSWSSPTWAAFAAMINEARSKHGLSSMGLLNPLIYPLIGTANFRDITVGSNGNYSAGVGYDRVTGIGVPNLSVLLQTLGGTNTGQPTISGFSPTTGAVGIPVTISGSNLDRATVVQFNGVSASFTANSSTSLTATVPTGATTGPITVMAPAGNVTSTASFTVPTGPPANDNFANAQVISGTSGSITGTNAEATKESGEPNHAGNAGGSSVWYSWTAPSAGIYTFDTTGSDFDTLLGIYTGSAVGALTETASNDDAGTGVTSSVSFTATVGTVYSIAVDGHDGAIGNLHLDWVKNTAGPTINSFAPSSGGAGTTVVINGANLSGANSVTFSGVSANFTVISATQVSAVVPPSAATGVITIATLAGHVTSAAVFSITNPPPNDNFANAQGLAGASGTVTGSNLQATKEPNEPNHAGQAGGHSVWYSWTAPETKAVTFNTFGSSFDTLLAVYTGTALSNLVQVAADNHGGLGFNSVVVFQATAGTVYNIAVDGGGGVTGSIVLNWNSDIAAPTLDSFSPPTGSSGAQVILTGSSLSTVTQVLFFDGVAATFTINSDTQITALVPAAAATGPITVSNPIGSAPSATDFVVSASVSNNNFVNAATFPGVGTVSGSNVGATKEGGEPDHAGNAGGASVWWNWTAPQTGSYTVTTLGSSFDTLLAVYTGSDLSSLTAVASNDDDPSGGSTSLVTFKATAGTVYRIAVDGFGGATGDILLSVLADSGGTIFSTGFEVAEGYSTSSALAGQNGWLVQGTGATGVVNNYFDGQGQQAYLGLTGAASHSSTYLWQPLDYTPAQGDIVTFQVSMQVVDSTNRIYDDFQWQVYNQEGDNLFTLDFNNSTQKVGYALDNGAATHSTGFQFDNSSVYVLVVSMDFAHNLWSASIDGTAIVTNQPITTTGANLDLGDIDACWNVLGLPGDNYLLFDNYSVRNTGNTAPEILLQPQDITTNQGTSVSLRTVATGTQPITYQWLKDGSTIPGATSPTLLLNNVQPADAGGYTVNISNVAGNTSTNSARLIVNAIQAANLAPNKPSGWSDRLIVSGNSASTTDDPVLLTGEPLYLGASIINNGTAPAMAQFKSIVYLDGALLSTWTQAAGLAPGSVSSQTGISIGTLTAGTHQLQFIIDSDNKVVETNEGDNTYLKTIVVNPSADYAVITATPSPTIGGSISGAGIIAKGLSVTLTAVASTNYTFLNWTEGGTVVSTASTYRFSASASRTLVGNFAMMGALPSIVVDSPAGGSSTVQSTASVSGTATGSAGIAKVFWSNSLGGSGTATGTTNWTIAGLPLKSGKANVITITAIDALNQLAITKLTITRDTLGSFAGTYTGLLVTQGSSPAYLGEGRITIGASGSFSALVYFEGKRSAFTGKIDENGNITHTVNRSGLPALNVAMAVLATPKALSGTIGDGTTTVNLMAVRPAYSSRAPWPHPGRYTLLLQSNPQDTAAPPGNGYGLITISKLGAVTLAGKMSDGTVISQAASIVADGTWPFFVSLYQATGYAAGPALVAETPGGDISGPVDWVRPAKPTATTYAAGFQTRVTLLGSTYLPGSASVPVMGAGNRPVELGDANQADTALTKTASLNANGTFTISPAGTDALQLKVQRATGKITGSFRDPNSNTKLTLEGAVLQVPDSAGGFYLTPSTGGYLDIGPLPATP